MIYHFTAHLADGSTEGITSDTHSYESARKLAKQICPEAVTFTDRDPEAEAAEQKRKAEMYDDLLAALKACDEYWSCGAPVHPYSFVANEARAAIARAEGGEG